MRKCQTVLQSACSIYTPNSETGVQIDSYSWYSKLLFLLS